MTNQRGALWSRDPPSTNHSSPGDGDHVDDEDVADHGHQGDQHVADSQQDRHGARHLPAGIVFRLVIVSKINNLQAASMLECSTYPRRFDLLGSATSVLT